MKYLIFSLTAILGFAFAPLDSHAATESFSHKATVAGAFDVYAAGVYTSENLITPSSDNSGVSVFSSSVVSHPVSQDTAKPIGFSGDSSAVDYSPDFQANHPVSLDLGNIGNIKPLVESPTMAVPFYARVLYKGSKADNQFAGWFDTKLGKRLPGDLECPSCQIPEPMTMSLLAAGLLGGALKRRRSPVAA